MSGSTVELKRLSSITYGLGQPPPLADEGVPILRATNIERGRITRKDLIFAALEDLPTDRVPLVRAEETLVVRSGAYTGDSALVTPEWQGASPGYDLRVTPLPGLEPRFLAYSLLGQLALDHMVLASSRAAQPHLNAAELGEVSILSVPLERQRAIADYLDAETARIDALIAKKRQLGGALEQRRAGEIEKVIAGAPAGSYLVSGVKLPYTSAPLKRLLGATLPGGTPDTNDQGSWAGADASDGLPWVAIGDMVDRGITATTAKCVTREGLGASRLSAAPAGTLLFAMYASVGKLTVLAMPAVWNQAILGLVPRTDRVSVQYLALWLEVLRPHLTSIARSNTQDNLNAEQVGNMPVPLRSRGEQDQVVARLLPRLSRFSSAQLSLTNQIALLQERRQALITAAVTGELDLAEAG